MEARVCLQVKISEFQVIFKLPDCLCHKNVKKKIFHTLKINEKSQKQKHGYKNIVYILSAVTKYLHTLYQYHHFCPIRAKKVHFENLLDYFKR